MHNAIKKINGALDRGLSKKVFDHVRNYMICAFILAIGTTELRQQGNQVFDFVPPGYAGSGVISFAVILICVNLYGGIRRIWATKYHISLSVALVFLYLFMSVRVVEMAWDFRDLSG